MGLRQILKDAGADLLKKGIVWWVGVSLAPYLLTFVPKIRPILLTKISVPVWVLISAIPLLALGGIIYRQIHRSRMRPRLYVHPVLGQSVWQVVRDERESRELMQVIFSAHLNHDDDKQTLVITDVYPQGTTTQISMLKRIAITPCAMSNLRIDAMVSPIKGKPGKSYETRMVLVDQFQRRYKTKKITFKWVGVRVDG